MAYVSLDSDQIKKAHKKHKYTKEQVLQLEQCMDPKSGPLFFMKNFHENTTSSERINAF